MKSSIISILTYLLILLITSCNSGRMKTNENQIDSSIKFDIDKEHLLVGTFTNSNSKGIYKLELDLSTGMLSNKKLLVEQESPSFLCISKDGKTVYSSNGTKPGSISVFKWNNDKTQLFPFNKFPSEGQGACHIELNEAQNMLAVSNYSSGNIAVYPIDEQGEVSGKVQSRQHLGSGPVLPNQTSAHAHCSKFDASGNFLYTADLGVDKILSYSIGPEGKLGQQQTALSLDAGDGPRHLIFHPSQNMVFIINELSSSVVSARVDSRKGTFEKIDKKSSLPPDYSEKNSCADIHLSADARFLYASNRGHNSIAIFSVSKDGKLELIAHESARGDWPRNFTLSPNGEFLLVANRRSDNITVFKIDKTSGLLSFTGNQIEVSEPVCLKFMDKKN